MTQAAALPADRPVTHPTWLVAAGRFLFARRNLVFPVVLVPLVGTRPQLALGSVAADRALDAVGIAVALAGQALRAAAIGLAYIRRGGRDGRPAADELVQEGLFAHSRNPLYLGNLLGILGIALVHHSPWLYAIGLPFFVFAYVAIVVAEEDFLAARFGPAYLAYARAVPRFGFRLRGLGSTLRSMGFDWRRLLRKEYGTTFSGASLLIWLVWWDRRRIFGPQDGALTAALMAWCALLVAYLAVRSLKKSGRLGTG